MQTRKWPGREGVPLAHIPTPENGCERGVRVGGSRDIHVQPSSHAIIVASSSMYSDGAERKKKKTGDCVHERFSLVFQFESFAGERPVVYTCTALRNTFPI